MQIGLSTTAQTDWMCAWQQHYDEKRYECLRVGSDQILFLLVLILVEGKMAGNVH